MFYHLLLFTNMFRSLYSCEATLMIAEAIETNCKLIICDKTFYLPRVMKHYSPTGKRNHGRPLTRLPDT